MKVAAIEAQADLERIAAEAARNGMVLRIAVVTCDHGARTPHWMFDDAELGTRVMNYWPGNGRFNNNGRGDKLERGLAENTDAALRKAVEFHDRFLADLDRQAARHLADIQEGRDAR